ncbi:hypothetical protein [Nocardiopsis salina]|uniref:hypothetical protein n=1 Tax=Nocardiopsis salina TaxID=245836 RepID=UPI00034A96FC|nr:hypothetical protein [Nocardiopsis salina]
MFRADSVARVSTAPPTDRAPRSFQPAHRPHAGDVAILETAMYDKLEHAEDEELQRALQEALDRRG